MMITLLLLLYIVMITIMGNHIRGILLSRLAILSLSLYVMLYELPPTTLALVDYQLIMDDHSKLFELLVLLIGLVLLASTNGHQFRNNPIAILLIIANIGGALLLISSKDWLVSLAAWELFNLALYLLAGAMGLHYFLLSAFATTLFMGGITIFYALTGTTSMLVVTGGLSGSMILVAILAKLGVAPFHNWAPDLYSTLPFSLTAFFATVPKIVLLAFLYSNTAVPMVGITTFSTLCFIVGSIGLSGSWQIGRFIAYSSVVHLGYFMLASSTLLFYALVYSLALLNLFLVISSMSGSKDKVLLLTMGSNKALLVAFAVSLFSLAAIPPFIGFFAKLAVLQVQIYWLAVIAVLASTLSAANYLSLVTLSLFSITTSRAIAGPMVPQVSAYFISTLTLLLIFGSIIVES